LEPTAAADGDFFTGVAAFLEPTAAEARDMIFFTLEAVAADGDFFTGAAAFFAPAIEDGDVFTRATAGAAAAQDWEFFRGVLATTA